MNQGQRIGLISGAAAAAVALIIVLVGVATPGRSVRDASHSSPATGRRDPGGLAMTGTTVDLSPVPGGPATTAAAGHLAVPTTLPPPTTTTVASPPAVGSAGAYLVPPSSTSVRVADPLNCTAMSDGPSWSTACGVAHATGGDLMWTIERMPVSGGTAWHAYVLRHVQGYQWQVILAAADDTGQRQWTSVRAVAVDVTGDGNQDIVFGFRSPPPGLLLVVDVVSGPGRVNLHRDYLEGSVQMTTGEIDAWGAGPGGVGYGHEVLRYLSGAWRIVSSTPAPPVIPPSSV